MDVNVNVNINTEETIGDMLQRLCGPDANENLINTLLHYTVEHKLQIDAIDSISNIVDGKPNLITIVSAIETFYKIPTWNNYKMIIELTKKQLPEFPTDKIEAMDDLKNILCGKLERQFNLGMIPDDIIKIVFNEMDFDALSSLSITAKKYKFLLNDLLQERRNQQYKTIKEDFPDFAKFHIITGALIFTKSFFTVNKIATFDVGKPMNFSFFSKPKHQLFIIGEIKMKEYIHIGAFTRYPRLLNNYLNYLVWEYLRINDKNIRNNIELEIEYLFVHIKQAVYTNIEFMTVSDFIATRKNKPVLHMLFIYGDGADSTLDPMLNILKLFIKHDENVVNIRDDDGNTLLHSMIGLRLASNGHLVTNENIILRYYTTKMQKSLIEFLLKQKKIDITIKNLKGEDIMMLIKNDKIKTIVKAHLEEKGMMEKPKSQTKLLQEFEAMEIHRNENMTKY